VCICEYLHNKIVQIKFQSIGISQSPEEIIWIIMLTQPEVWAFNNWFTNCDFAKYEKYGLEEP